VAGTSRRGALGGVLVQRCGRLDAEVHGPAGRSAAWKNVATITGHTSNRPTAGTIELFADRHGTLTERLIEPCRRLACARWTCDQRRTRYGVPGLRSSLRGRTARPQWTPAAKRI